MSSQLVDFNVLNASQCDDHDEYRRPSHAGVETWKRFPNYCLIFTQMASKLVISLLRLISDGHKGDMCQPNNYILQNGPIVTSHLFDMEIHSA